ncbi:MAG: hypothetical protein ACK5AZ_26720 [Bryobacteraceae bacterium]
MAVLFHDEVAWELFELVPLAAFPPQIQKLIMMVSSPKVSGSRMIFSAARYSGLKRRWNPKAIVFDLSARSAAAGFSQ